MLPLKLPSVPFGTLSEFESVSSPGTERCGPPENDSTLPEENSGNND